MPRSQIASTSIVCIISLPCTAADYTFHRNTHVHGTQPVLRLNLNLLMYLLLSSYTHKGADASHKRLCACAALDAYQAKGMPLCHAPH